MMKAFKKGDVVSFETDNVSDWIERGRDGFQHEQSKSKRKNREVQTRPYIMENSPFDEIEIIDDKMSMLRV